MSNWPILDLPKYPGVLPELKITTTSGEFSVAGKKEFRSYICGITPYDATHLGHAATYLTFDLIHRYLIASGLDLNFVENITDIDDPLFERAIRDNQSWKELGNSQIALFESDMSALRILPPKVYMSVTTAMDLIITAIVKLVSLGNTYELGGNVYFKISNYLPELPISLEEAEIIFQECGGDPGQSGKENPLDPMLWVANKDGEPGWDSPIGFGRPGWHIECSVIALRFLLGSDYLERNLIKSYEIDLQGGGSDLIFPHHFMTAALGQALTNNEFAQAYVHGAMVGYEGEKMSKSKGNLVLVSTLLSKGFDPMEIRYSLLTQHHTEDWSWDQSKLDSAINQIAHLRLALSKVDVAPTDDLIAAVSRDVANNLDTPTALKRLDSWATASIAGEVGGSAGELARFLDSILGLAL